MHNRVMRVCMFISVAGEELPKSAALAPKYRNLHYHPTRPCSPAWYPSSSSRPVTYGRQTVAVLNTASRESYACHEFAGVSSILPNKGSLRSGKFCASRRTPLFSVSRCCSGRTRTRAMLVRLDNLRPGLETRTPLSSWALASC